MTVSFVVCAYNEEKYLPSLLSDLESQDYPRELTEVILVNSASSDSTAEIMRDFALAHGGDYMRVSVLENPAKRLACGCNVALRDYTGDVFVRVDAHASIPRDFISRGMRAISDGEYAVGGRRPSVSESDGAWNSALLAAERSMFGSGIASYRNGEKKKYADSVFHGFYRREVFDRVGYYDERLGRTEDNDMSCRIRRAGYGILYDPQIVSYQLVRPTARKMMRQKYLNGYWIGKTLSISPDCVSLFHLVPFVFLLAVLGCGALSLAGVGVFSALLWGAYAVFVVAASLVEFLKEKKASMLVLPLMFLCLHIAYGAGTLVGLAVGAGEKEGDNR